MLVCYREPSVASRYAIERDTYRKRRIRLEREKKIMVRGSGNDTFDFQLKFDRFRGSVYVELMPVSRGTQRVPKGKAIHKMALRFHNDVVWHNLMKAIEEMENWIEDNDGWGIQRSG